MPTLALILVLLLSGFVSACGSGGSDAPASLTPSGGLNGPPAPARLLYQTDQTLVRGQTDGENRLTLVQTVGQRVRFIGLSGQTVVYETESGANAFLTDRDLWRVSLDGTAQVPLVETKDFDDFGLDVIGSWLIHTRGVIDGHLPRPTATRSLSLLDGSSVTLVAPSLLSSYQRQVAGRAVLSLDNNLVSVLPGGADRRQLTFYPVPQQPLGNEIVTLMFGVRGVVGNRMIYLIGDSISNPVKGQGNPKLFTVPVLGGPSVPLGGGIESESVGGIVGQRVVFHSCTVVFADPGNGELDLVFDRCNVTSIQSDGRGRVVLVATPEINYVQGIIGEQVIIRRSQLRGVTDHLFSIPATGGVETPLLPLSARNEFVSGIVADRIILQRPTGFWSLKADGSELTQLTTEDHSIEPISQVGAFVCFNRGEALWCVPADGSAPATQVTAQGTFVAGL